MKKIFSAALFLGLAASLFAQEDKQFRFGPFITPLVSFTSADNKEAESGGAQVGVNLAMIGEYYFDADRNYALTAGIGYTIGYGGQMKYSVATNHFDTQDGLSTGFRTALSACALATSTTDQPAGTIIRQTMNMVNIPIGFKMRTNELGGSMIRAFAQLPVIGINIVTESKIDAELPGYGKFEGETYLKNTVPIGISIGGGLGAEWYPNDKGLGITAGIFYNNGLIDINANTNSNKYRVTASDISLRLGVFF